MRFGAVLVDGASMQPVLRAGDACLVGYDVRLRPGDVVVARLPARPLGVKRARLLDADGWWLSSENPREGTDSSTFGSVAESEVLGRVLLRYWPWPAWCGRSGNCPDWPAARARRSR